MDAFKTIKPPIIIAEAGNNHEGDLHAALELIAQAKNVGADIVKFQAGTAEGFTRTAEDIPRYRKYELGEKGYVRLVKAANEIGIPIMFSVWGNEAWLDKFRWMTYFKIAARQCKLDYILAYDRPGCFISIPTTEENPAGLGINHGIPMHVVSQYPAVDPMLDRIGELQHIFGGRRPVGYSDHTIGIDACIQAVERCEAFAIEKHFTLDHDYGPLRDHKLSATPAEMFRLVKWLKRPKLDVH